MLRVLSKDRLELLYAKNRPCTTAENAYVAAIFRVVRQATVSVHVTCWSLLSLVISTCKRKMRSRALKIGKSLSALSAGDEVAIYDASCTVAAENFLRNALGSGAFSVTKTMPQFLRGWFTYLQEPNGVCSHWASGNVYQMLHIAYYIGQSPGISKILNKTLLHRVRKLGDYYGAALVLIRDAGQLPNDQLQHLRITEVVPPTPRSLSLHANFVDTINAWARHVGEPEVSEALLRTAFPDMEPLPADPQALQSVTISVHCECTLLLAMIRKSTTAASASAAIAPAPLLLEMGVSKSSCLMCHEFIVAVQTLYRHITVKVSSCHGKHAAGWSLAGSVPTALRDVMTKRLSDEMDELLERATRKRKFDSMPRASPPTAGTPAPSGEQIIQTVTESGATLFSV